MNSHSVPWLRPEALATVKRRVLEIWGKAGDREGEGCRLPFMAADPAQILGPGVWSLTHARLFEGKTIHREGRSGALSPQPEQERKRPGQLPPSIIEPGSMVLAMSALDPSAIAKVG